MDSIRSILPRVLHKRGLHVQAQASLVTHTAELWLQSALPHLSDAISVSRYAHTTLSVSCKHSIAAQECLPLIPALKEYLLRQCKGQPVGDILLLRDR